MGGEKIKRLGTGMILALMLMVVVGPLHLVVAQTSESITIKDLQATESEVTLQGTGKIQAVAFILGDPIRLRVDIKNAMLDYSVPSSIPVNGNPIQSVTASALKVKEQNVVRLELALTQDVEWRFQPSGERLTISLVPKQLEVRQDIPEDIYERAREVEEQLYATGTYSAPPSDIRIPEQAAYSRPIIVPETAPPAPARPSVVPSRPLEGGSATQVIDILYRFSAGQVQILIKTNGTVGTYQDFTLTRPNRLVIDLPGLKEASPKDQFSIAHSGVQRVRLGAHPGKTRVVVDFSGPIPAYSFSRVKQGLVVTLSPR